MVIDSANVPYVFMLIVQDMLGLGRWWIISFYVSDVLLEAGPRVPAGLTYIRDIVGFQVNR